MLNKYGEITAYTSITSLNKCWTINDNLLSVQMTASLNKCWAINRLLNRLFYFILFYEQ